ncbi:MAG: GHKL domain-containing protein [bacterium]|nr:GHKL domain-containing protein [bacterium]
MRRRPDPKPGIPPRRLGTFWVAVVLLLSFGPFARAQHEELRFEWISVEVYILLAVGLAAAVASYLWSHRRAVERERAINRRLQEADGVKQKLIIELEAKNKELEGFTYTVSHDLKSPLVTIKNFLGFLKRDVEAGRLDRLGEDIDRITGATERMQGLLQELLELSRIGRMMNPPEEVPFGNLAHEAAELVAGRISERGAEIHIEPDLPTVRVDRVRLLQVIQNLIDNAVKYTPEAETPRIEIGARSDGGETVLFVRDHGSGIDPRHHERVFGLFEQLDSSRPGTGIGLALVSRIVEAHGGRLWVESEGEGRGSTFCFTLPRG